MGCFLSVTEIKKIKPLNLALAVLLLRNAQKMQFPQLKNSQVILMEFTKLFGMNLMHAPPPTKKKASYIFLKISAVTR